MHYVGQCCQLQTDVVSRTSRVRLLHLGSKIVVFNCHAQWSQHKGGKAQKELEMHARCVDYVTCCQHKKVFAWERIDSAPLQQWIHFLLGETAPYSPLMSRFHHAPWLAHLFIKYMRWHTVRVLWLAKKVTINHTVSILHGLCLAQHIKRK